MNFLELLQQDFLPAKSYYYSRTNNIKALKKC